MKDLILFIIRWILNILLGGCFGLPVMLFTTFKAASWAKTQDFPTKPKSLPKSISRRFAETETGLTMEYLSSTETSASKKIAIFLHGFPDAATSWIPLMLKFQNDGFKTFAPSQRGYGQTRSNEKDEVEDYDLDCLADDVAAFIEKVVADKTKVTLVIHDWGSVVGFHVARRRPDLVERVIGINSVSLPAYFETVLGNLSQILASYYIYFFQFPKIPEALLKANDFALLKALCVRMGTPKEDVEDVISGMGLRTRDSPFTEPINWYRSLGRKSLHLMIKQKERTKKTASIQQNVLILWGDKDEALIKELPENERKFITGDLEVKHFADYGHNMFHANPEGCWNSIKQWLDKQ